MKLPFYADKTFENLLILAKHRNELPQQDI